MQNSPPNPENGSHQMVGQQSLLKSILNFFNPFYHIKRFKEDMQVSKAALLARKKILKGETIDQPLHEIFRGKLFGVFFLTGWTAMLGFAAGYGVQRIYDSQWVGLYLTPVLIYIITAIAYQIGWFLDNRKLYAQMSKDSSKRFFLLQRDLVPVHWTGLKFAIIFNIINLLVGSAITGLITWISEPFAKIFPAAISVMVAEALFVSGPFVRVMGDFFDKHSHTLALRHEPHISTSDSEKNTSN